MKTEARMSKIDKLIEKYLSPESRDRICPQCKEPFYADHLSKKFCSDKCADNFYNEKTRPLKQAVKLIEHSEAEVQQMEEYKNSLFIPENILRKNIEVFDRLSIDPIAGSNYRTSDLGDLGVNFNVFSYREKIPGLNEACYAIICGCYKITNLNNEIIKIEKPIK